MSQRLKMALMVLEVLVRLLRGLPRLRKEAREAMDAAGAAYRELRLDLRDRDLTREEVAALRRKVEALGKETEDVFRVLGEVLGLEEKP